MAWAKMECALVGLQRTFMEYWWACLPDKHNCLWILRNTAYLHLSACFQQTLPPYDTWNTSHFMYYLYLYIYCRCCICCFFPKYRTSYQYSKKLDISLSARYIWYNHATILYHERTKRLNNFNQEFVLKRHKFFLSPSRLWNFACVLIIKRFRMEKKWKTWK